MATQAAHAHWRPRPESAVTPALRMDQSKAPPTPNACVALLVARWPFGGSCPADPSCTWGQMAMHIVSNLRTCRLQCRFLL